jgi:hypothetical protein
MQRLFCNCCNYTCPALSCQSRGKKEKKEERESEKTRGKGREMRKSRKRGRGFVKSAFLSGETITGCVPSQGGFADFLSEDISSVRRSVSEQV